MRCRVGSFRNALCVGFWALITISIRSVGATSIVCGVGCDLVGSMNEHVGDGAVVISLAADANVSQPAKVGAAANLTLEGNGHTVRFYKSSEGCGRINVKGGGLHVVDARLMAMMSSELPGTSNSPFNKEECDVHGGIISATDHASVSLTDVVLSHGRGLYGGAVYAESSNLQVLRCEFSGNGDPIVGLGGAVYVFGEDTRFAVSHSTFTANVAHRGSALAALLTPTVSVKYSTFLDNSGEGMIFAYGSRFEVLGSHFQTIAVDLVDGGGDHNGAAIVNYESELLVVETNVSSGTLTSDPGALLGCAEVGSELCGPYAECVENGAESLDCRCPDNVLSLGGAAGLNFEPCSHSAAPTVIQTPSPTSITPFPSRSPTAIPASSAITPKLADALLTSRLIVVYFDTATDRGSGASNVPCHTLFLNADSFGSGAQCIFINEFLLHVRLGVLGVGKTMPKRLELKVRSGNTDDPSTVYIRALGASPTAPAATGSIAIRWPNPLPAPLPLIDAPSSVGPCDSPVIDGGLSEGLLGQPFEVSWILLDVPKGGSNSASVTLELEEALTACSGSLRCALKPTALGIEGTYRIGMRLRNAFGVSGSAMAIVRRTETRGTPIVTIGGPNSRSVLRSGEIRFRASAVVFSCGSGEPERAFLRYSWSVVTVGSDAEADSALEVRGDPSSATFDASALAKNVDELNVRVVVSQSFAGSELSNSANVRVLILPSPLEVVITGASVRSLVNGMPLLLDGSQSQDPDDPESALIYRWTCFPRIVCAKLHVASEDGNLGHENNLTAGEADGARPGELILVNWHRASSLSMQGSGWVAGMTYTFGLEVRRFVAATGDDFARSTIAIEVLPGVIPAPKRQFLPEVFLAPFASMVSPNAPLRLRGTCGTLELLPDNTTVVIAEGDDDVPPAVTAWTQVTSAESPRLRGSAFSTPLNGPFLVIRAGALAGGGQYTFRLSCLLPGETDGPTTFAQATVRVHVPPTGGNIEVGPPKGVAALTLFELSTFNWDALEEALPLSYQFSFMPEDIAVPVTLSSYSVSPTVTSELPWPGVDSSGSANITVMAEARDTLGAVGIGPHPTFTVALRLPGGGDQEQVNENEAQAWLEDTVTWLDDLVKTPNGTKAYPGGGPSIYNAVSAAASVLNVQTCSQLGSSACDAGNDVAVDAELRLGMAIALEEADILLQESAPEFQSLRASALLQVVGSPESHVEAHDTAPRLLPETQAIAVEFARAVVEGSLNAVKNTTTTSAIDPVTAFVIAESLSTLLVASDFTAAENTTNINVNATLRAPFNTSLVALECTEKAIAALPSIMRLEQRNRCRSAQQTRQGQGDVHRRFLRGRYAADKGGDIHALIEVQRAIAETVRALASAQIANSVPTEDAVHLAANQITLTSLRSSPAALSLFDGVSIGMNHSRFTKISNRTRRLMEDVNDRALQHVVFNLPESISPALENVTGGNDDLVDIYVCTYGTNPRGAESRANIKAQPSYIALHSLVSTVSVSVTKNVSFGPVEVAGLSKPVVAKIPLLNTSAPRVGDATELVCGAWNENGLFWDTEGCEFKLLSQGEGQCSCSHLSDWSVWEETKADFLRTIKGGGLSAEELRRAWIMILLLAIVLVIGLLMMRWGHRADRRDERVRVAALVLITTHSFVRERVRVREAFGILKKLTLQRFRLRLHPSGPTANAGPSPRINSTSARIKSLASKLRSEARVIAKVMQLKRSVSSGQRAADLSNEDANDEQCSEEEADGMPSGCLTTEVSNVAETSTGVHSTNLSPELPDDRKTSYFGRFLPSSGIFRRQGFRRRFLAARRITTSAFKTHHVWVAWMTRYDPYQTRPQRVVLFISGVLGKMLASAIVFNFRSGHFDVNAGQLVLVGLFSACIVGIFIGPLHIVFARIEPKVTSNRMVVWQLQKQYRSERDQEDPIIAHHMRAVIAAKYRVRAISKRMRDQEYQRDLKAGGLTRLRATFFYYRRSIKHPSDELQGAKAHQQEAIRALNRVLVHSSSRRKTRYEHLLSKTLSQMKIEHAARLQELAKEFPDGYSRERLEREHALNCDHERRLSNMMASLAADRRRSDIELDDNRETFQETGDDVGWDGAGGESPTLAVEVVSTEDHNSTTKSSSRAVQISSIPRRRSSIDNQLHRESFPRRRMSAQKNPLWGRLRPKERKTNFVDVVAVLGSLSDASLVRRPPRFVLPHHWHVNNLSMIFLCLIVNVHHGCRSFTPIYRLSPCVSIRGVGGRDLNPPLLIPFEIRLLYRGAKIRAQNIFATTGRW